MVADSSNAMLTLELVEQVHKVVAQNSFLYLLSIVLESDLPGISFETSSLSYHFLSEIDVVAHEWMFVAWWIPHYVFIIRLSSVHTSTGQKIFCMTASVYTSTSVLLLRHSKPLPLISGCRLVHLKF